MNQDLDFSSTEFSSATPQARIAKCREMAAEAVRLAAKASDPVRAAYDDIAKQWTTLADEMDAELSRETTGQSH